MTYKRIKINVPKNLKLFTLNDGSTVIATSEKDALMIDQTITECINLEKYSKFRAIADSLSKPKNTIEIINTVSDIENASDTKICYDRFLHDRQIDETKAGNIPDYDFDSTAIYGNDFESVKPKKLIDSVEIESAMKSKNAMCEYVARNDIHSIIAYSIVKKIANGPTTTVTDSCSRIVNSGYTDTIFDDIKDDLYIAIHCMIESDKAWIIQDGSLFFDSYETASGKTRTHYFDLFTAVRQSLTKYSDTNRNTDKSLDSANTISDMRDFVQESELDKIVSSELMQSFYKYMHNHEKDDDIFHVLYGLLSCMEYNDIAKKYGFKNDRRVKYLKNKLESYSEKFFGRRQTFTVTYHKFNKDGSMKVDKNGNPKVYSYEYYA